MSRRDHDSLMMDYLYDELTSAQREAFEQQMATDPALKAEVESLQGTRVLLQEAAVVDVVPVAPPLLMQNLMREARKAAHLEPQPTLFERFSALLFRPSFGAAALALVVVAVGVNLMQQQATSPNESTAAPASQPTMTVAVADETDKLERDKALEGRDGWARGGEELALEDRELAEVPAREAAGAAATAAVEERMPAEALTDNTVARLDDALPGGKGRFGKKTGGLSGGLDGGEVADAKMAFEANVAEANVAEGKLVKTEKSGELLNSKLDGNRVAANERAKAPTDAPAEAGDLDAGDAVAEAPAQPSAAAAVVGEDGGGSEVAQLDGVAVADMDNAGSPAGRYRSRRASKSGGKSGPGKLAPAMEKTQPLADDPADDLLALGAVGNDIPEPEADEEEAPAAAREQRKAPEPQQIAAAPKPAPRPSAQQSAMPKSGLNFKQGRADQVRLGRKDGESSNGLQWKDQQGKEQTANVQGPKPGSQIEVAQQKTNTRNKTRDLAQVGTAESTVALQKSNAPTTPAKPAQVVYGYDMAPAKKPAPSSTVQPIGSSRTKSIGSIATGTPGAEMPSLDIARGTGSTLSGSGGVGGQIGGSVAPKGGLEGQKQSNGDFERAMDHYKAKRYGNAIKDFEGYLARDGKNGQRAEAELNLARSLKARNRLADAATRYRGLLKRYPAYRYRSAVLVETARLEMQLGNLSAARDLLNQAVADKGQSDKARPLLKEINRRIVAREKARTKPATASKRKAAKPAKAKAASQPKPSGATKAAALL